MILRLIGLISTITATYRGKACMSCAGNRWPNDTTMPRSQWATCAGETGQCNKGSPAVVLNTSTGLWPLCARPVMTSNSLTHPLQQKEQWVYHLHITLLKILEYTGDQLMFTDIYIFFTTVNSVVFKHKPYEK